MYTISASPTLFFIRCRACLARTIGRRSVDVHLYKSWFRRIKMGIALSFGGVVFIQFSGLERRVRCLGGAMLHGKHMPTPEACTLIVIGWVNAGDGPRGAGLLEVSVNTKHTRPPRPSVVFMRHSLIDSYSSPRRVCDIGSA